MLIEQKAATDVDPPLRTLERTTINHPFNPTLIAVTLLKRDGMDIRAFQLHAENGFNLELPGIPLTLIHGDLIAMSKLSAFLRNAWVYPNPNYAPYKILRHAFEGMEAYPPTITHEAFSKMQKKQLMAFYYTRMAENLENQTLYLQRNSRTHTIRLPTTYIKSKLNDSEVLLIKARKILGNIYPPLSLEDMTDLIEPIFQKTSIL